MILAHEADELRLEAVQALNRLDVLTMAGATRDQSSKKSLVANDAIYPAELGGTHLVLDNLGVAHAACNSAKGAKLLSEPELIGTRV